MFSLFWLLLVSLAAGSVVANTGEATYYDPGLGACGITNSSADLIVAVAQEYYDTFPGATANPNLNPVCNKTLTAHYKTKSVTVTITDKCPGCKGKYDLDLSPAAFKRLANPSLGRLHGVTWELDKKSTRDIGSATATNKRGDGHRMVRRRRVANME